LEQTVARQLAITERQLDIMREQLSETRRAPRIRCIDRG
jgi:hypothetical protein